MQLSSAHCPLFFSVQCLCVRVATDLPKTITRERLYLHESCFGARRQRGEGDPAPYIQRRAAHSCHALSRFVTPPALPPSHHVTSPESYVTANTKSGHWLGCRDGLTQPATRTPLLVQLPPHPFLQSSSSSSPSSASASSSSPPPRLSSLRPSGKGTQIKQPEILILFQREMEG